MDADTKMGPEAAATAIRTHVVALEKQTLLLCPKSSGSASEFSHAGGAQ